jgi:hypothetical protein
MSCVLVYNRQMVESESDVLQRYRIKPNRGGDFADYVREEGILYGVIDENGELLFRKTHDVWQSQAKINVPFGDLGMLSLDEASGEVLTKVVNIVLAFREQLAEFIEPDPDRI